MEEILTALQDETGGTAFILATVEAVAEGGVKLQIDGQDKAGEKLYPCNAGALFRPGDRVKLTPDSGTYIVDFPMGKPGERYPIPKGGSEGQLLAKAGGNDFTLKWLDAPDGGENYIPKGGTAGQVLTKKNSYDYELQWSNVPENPLPTGGSDGQVLMKSGSTNYAVKWAAPNFPASKLANGIHTVELSTAGLLAPVSSGSVDLGNSSRTFGDLYCNGTIKLGQGYGNSIQLGASSATLGFFGMTPTARKTVASTATVAALITALKSYGLIG